MKKLPFFKRPFFAKTVLEIGGGHNPHQGVTHAVDKYPQDNFQRAGDLAVAEGVEFREGEIEAIPFSPEKKFDFFYASHILEHVHDPEKAVSEINRVAARGYIETPSPLREQITCPFPLGATLDYHPWFCWVSKTPHTLHVAKKTEETLGEFCDCEDGKFGKYLFFLQRKLGYDLEPLIPGTSKSSVLYFSAPLRLVVHPSLGSACASGACAYASVREVLSWSAFPRNLTARRFKKLQGILREHQDFFRT